MVPLLRCSTIESKVAGFALKGKYLIYNQISKNIRYQNKICTFSKDVFLFVCFSFNVEVCRATRCSAQKCHILNIVYSYDTAGCIRESPYLKYVMEVTLRKASLVLIHLF